MNTIAGYGITEHTHEDCWPTREYFELCWVCATPLQKQFATARITQEEAEAHGTTCAICGRYMARIEPLVLGLTARPF